MASFLPPFSLLQAENSALAQANENQRETYERCLDEVCGACNRTDVGGMGRDMGVLQTEAGLADSSASGLSVPRLPTTWYRHF